MLNKVKLMMNNIYYRFVDNKKWIPIIDASGKYGKFAYYNIKTHKTVKDVSDIFLNIFYKILLEDKKFTKLYEKWKLNTEWFTVVEKVGNHTYHIVVIRNLNNNTFDVQLEIVNEKTFWNKSYIKEKEYELAAKFIEIEMMKILLDSRKDIIKDIYFENNTNT